MTSAPHRVARLTVTASVADLDLAFGLRARIERLAWEMMPAAIGQVCDAIGLADMHLRIARLDLDLGRVRPDHLEEDALDALQRALSDALAHALHRARYSPSDAARLVDPAAMLVEDFDRYLRSGQLPIARREIGFDAAARLRWLIAEQPDALIRLLVRRARDRHALERLVLQTGEEGFGALLELLAPRDAEVILTLLVDVALAHRDPPVPIPSALSASALGRVLRVATLEFLLRDPGSQFNRRRFLAHLLRREARAMGVDYAVLLRLLGDAVAALRAQQGLRSSLPRILSELLAEPGAEGDAVQPAADSSPAAAIAAARAGEFDALLAQLRRVVGDRTALEALVDRLSAELFAGLIERLDPANAALILAMLDDLTLVERADPVLAIERFEVSLRALTLTYLVRDPGTQFNRRRFLAFLIAREAARAQIGYRDLVRLFADALGRLRSHQGLRASLPAVLAELVDEVERAEPIPGAGDAARGVRGDIAALLMALEARARDPAALRALLRDLPAPLFARLLRRLRPASAATMLSLVETLAALPLARISTAEWTAWVRAAGIRWLLRAPTRRFDRRAWSEAMVAELAARGGVDEAALHRILTDLDQGAAETKIEALVHQLENGVGDAALFTALRQAVSDPLSLTRLAARLGPKDRERVLAHLDPHGALATQALRRFAMRHAASPLLDLDAAGFDRLLWTLAIAWWAEDGRGAFDAAAFARAIAGGIARSGGEQEDAVVLALMEELRPVARDPQRLVDQYLRGGAPRGAGRGLPALYAADPDWLATAIRRHARSAPAHRAGMIERLLRWLTPDELVDCLAPGLGARALRWADAMGGVDAAHWQDIIMALLAGKAPAFVALPAVSGRRLDRIALLCDWLDHGIAPWWSPDADAIATALAELPQASFAELEQLFGGGGRGFARLWRVIEAAEPALGAALFDRLIPWATRPRGALAAALDRLAPRARRLALTRAAADALAGEEPDLARLAAPVAPPPAIDPAAPSAAPDPAGIDTARLLAWLDGGTASAAERSGLVRRFAMLADHDDPALLAWLDARRGDARAVSRWAALLPVEALGRLVRLLVPGGAQLWLDAAAMLAAAARRGATFGSPSPDPVQLWTALLHLVAARDAPAPVPGVAQLIGRLAGDDSERGERLRRDALRLAQDGGHRAAAAALRRAAPAATPVVAPSRAPPRTASGAGDDDDEDQPGMPPDSDDAIFIGNAGLILFGPYLPTLFERLGLLSETDKGPRMVDAEAMSRGVHLLQYLVDGRCDRPEPELVLNKLLCGLPSAQPVAAAIEPSEADRAICDGLISAVIANWPILGNSSPAALRETFLQREGRLSHGTDRWNLVVQRKTVDVLVDQVPWSIAMVYHRWMGEAVHVTW